ncbi:MAG: CDP-glycerol glycerophosphotransferase family protein [Ignavibacteriaceae bacterium]|nr:CDP-glycerol glycerophosphotransferase family protein [Ignavibacteriaceae bacterium]
MLKGKLLFICGSLNQTTMMHEISKHFDDYECMFTPYYADGFVELLRKLDLLDFTILGGRFKEQTLEYLYSNNLQIDYKGLTGYYDLVFTCSDLIVPKNIRKSKIILVQEGMTDPENFMYYLVKYLYLPRYLASTSTQGLSKLYHKFCVASEGYKNLFIHKGVKEDKIIVTGIPNFDNAKKFTKNNFPFKHFVLAATSDARETFKYENRKKFIQKVLDIANGRQVIFKLHPNENYVRAIKEINKYAPKALVLTNGSINEMIANCDVLITKYSSVVYVGMALGKEVYSDFCLKKLKELLPTQNGGLSANNIAQVGRDLLGEKSISSSIKQYEFNLQVT